MTYLIAKDRRQRQSLREREGAGLALRMVARQRAYAQCFPALAPKLGAWAGHTFSAATLKNRCILTGRPRAVYRFGHLSRLAFRRLAAAGGLAGVRKSSW